MCRLLSLLHESSCLRLSVMSWPAEGIGIRLHHMARFVHNTYIHTCTSTKTCDLRLACGCTLSRSGRHLDFFGALLQFRCRCAPRCSGSPNPRGSGSPQMERRRPSYGSRGGCNRMFLALQKDVAAVLLLSRQPAKAGR